MAHGKRYFDTLSKGMLVDLAFELSIDVDKLRAEVAELHDRQRWIPVSERTPENGMKVQTYPSHGYDGLTYNGYDGMFFRQGLKFFTNDVDYWRPLSATPEVSA